MNIRNFKVSPDTRRQRKILLLASAGVIFLVALFAIFFRDGNRFSEDTLSSIQVRFNGLEERLNHFDEMQDRIVLLEKREKVLQQSVSKLDRSGRYLRKQLDVLTQKFDQLQKRTALVAAKSKTPNPIREKRSFQSEGRYHKVRRGDSLYRIAKKYGVSVNELCRLNQISPDQIIRPDQELLISPCASHR